MRKETYIQIKEKEVQIENFKEIKKNIELGKITSINIRVFDDDKIEYKDINLKEIPRGAIKGFLLQHIEQRLSNAQNDFEDLFNK